MIDNSSTFIFDERLVSEWVPKVTYIKSQNRGIAQAKNLGVYRSSGDLLCFVADDYILPDDYFKVVKLFFGESIEHNILLFNIQFGSSNFSSKAMEIYFQLTLLQHIEPRSGVQFYQTQNIPISKAATLRRQVFEKVGIFNENLKSGEDTEFSLRLRAAGIPCHFYPDRYIVHDKIENWFECLIRPIRYAKGYPKILLIHKQYRYFLQPLLKGLFSAFQIVRKRLIHWKKTAHLWEMPHVNQRYFFWLGTVLLVRELSLYYFFRKELQKQVRFSRGIRNG